jgi:hypothetical protein
MLQRLLLAMIVVACIHTSSVKADLVVLDFQSLQQNDFTQHVIGSSYSEDGFTLQAMNSFSTLRSYGTQAWWSYPGSTTLHNGTNGGITRLTKSDGGLFDLLSIDLARLSISAGDVPVTFIGTFLNGSTITQSFNVIRDNPSAISLQTFDFAGFTNLTKVEWTQTSILNHQFDNVQLSTVSAVPVPSGIVLMSIAIVGMCMTRRKLSRHNHHQAA